MCYEQIKISFPDVDPVAVLGYMTDTELPRLSSIIESQPKSKKLKIEELELHGFGFCDLIKILRSENFDPSDLYYNIPQEKVFSKIIT